MQKVHHNSQTNTSPYDDPYKVYHSANNNNIVVEKDKNINNNGLINNNNNNNIDIVSTSLMDASSRLYVPANQRYDRDKNTHQSCSSSSSSSSSRATAPTWEGIVVRDFLQSLHCGDPKDLVVRYHVKSTSPKRRRSTIFRPTPFPDATPLADVVNGTVDGDAASAELVPRFLADQTRLVHSTAEHSEDPKDHHDMPPPRKKLRLQIKIPRTAAAAAAAAAADDDDDVPIERRCLIPHHDVASPPLPSLSLPTKTPHQMVLLQEAVAALQAEKAKCPYQLAPLLADFLSLRLHDESVMNQAYEHFLQKATKSKVKQEIELRNTEVSPPSAVLPTYSANIPIKMEDDDNDGPLVQNDFVDDSKAAPKKEIRTTIPCNVKADLLATLESYQSMIAMYEKKSLFELGPENYQKIAAMKQEVSRAKEVVVKQLRAGDGDEADGDGDGDGDGDEADGSDTTTGELGYVRFQGKWFPALVVNPYQTTWNIAKAYLKEKHEWEKANGHEEFKKKIIYWLGTEAWPEYNIISSHQMIGFDDAKEMESIQDSLQRLSKPGYLLRTNEKVTMVRGIKLATVLEKQPPQERFDRVKKWFVGIADDFFFNPDDVDSWTLQNINFNENDNNFDASLHEYIEDEYVENGILLAPSKSFEDDDGDEDYVD